MRGHQRGTSGNDEMVLSEVSPIEFFVFGPPVDVEQNEKTENFDHHSPDIRLKEDLLSLCLPPPPPSLSNTIE